MSNPREERRELLPHFVRVESSPPLPDTVGGIRLAADPPRSMPEGPVWALRGSFRVAPARGTAQQETLRRLVLAVTSDASHVTRARHALLDAALFGPDVKGSPADISGFFSLNLADLFEFENRSETFHLVASIGGNISDVLTCTVELPWVDWPRAVPPPPPKEAAAEEEGEEDDDDPGGPEDADDDEDLDEDDDSWMIDEEPLTDL
ncbi:MAG: hypothetical protein PVF68_13450 [Acidobacteriota bacterium]|jgi:hypothetical protein